MNSLARSLAPSLALAASLAIVAALAPDRAFAANGRMYAGGGRLYSGGSWHSAHGGSWHGDSWRHGGWGRPGVFWGGVGLGLGIGAIGYYGGWWGPYGYAPYYGYTPYYYDGYYYEPAPAVIVSPPVSTPVDPAARSGQPVPPSTRAPDPIFYPNKGQSAATTESDRRECNRWATTQNGAMADASIFQRATLACMEGRGYTVK
jgi:hypothetical protein